MTDLETDQLLDDEEPTMPYARLGYDASDVGVNEIRVRKVATADGDVLLVMVSAA